MPCRRAFPSAIFFLTQNKGGGWGLTEDSFLFIKVWSPAKRESSPASPEIIPKKPLVLTWGHDLTGEFYSPSLITKPALLERFVVG